MGNKNCAVGLAGRSPAITNNDRRAAEGVHPARPSRQTGSLWRLALCCTFAALLAPAQIAFADDLGTKNIRMSVDPADLPVSANGQYRSGRGTLKAVQDEVVALKTITAGPTLVGPNQYTISYQIDVINNNLTGLDSYELDETPHFGAGVVIDSATCASSVPVGTGTADSSPCAAAPAPIVLVNGTPFTLVAPGWLIDAGAVHRYALVVTFTVVPGSVTVATNGAGCDVTPPSPTTDTGLNNTATVTMTGGTPLATNACAPTPPALVVVKSDPVVLGTTATYTVTVTNTGGAGTYELTDSPLFGTGITVTAPPVCTNTSVLPGVGDTTPTCTTTTGPWALADPGTAIAAAVAVPVVDSYTVAVPFTVAPGTPPANLLCPAVSPLATGGLNNRADLTAAGATTTDTGCGSAPPPAVVTHAKTITAGPTPIGPNQYTISYQIDVTNSGGASGGYQLDETPHFGAGVVINSATCASSLAAGTGTPDLRRVQRHRRRSCW
ncbi:MAG: hypothetical protein IPI73_03385 [Betaproteobacteria bacterium]|nr:hypothetical protein [Betaproteobacteria bacterium]